MELRPYQEEARRAVFEEWRQGYKRTLLVLPTGCGKTIVFAKIAEECVRQGKMVLILAHRGELLEQASDKIERATGLRCAVEKAEQSSITSRCRIVVGSVQTLMREKRLNQFSRSYFDTIIIDEAHHCLSDGYQNILNYFVGSDILGVTATPDRGDKKKLGEFFDSLAYEYTLPKAIKAGYLCPIKAVTLPLRLDLSAVGVQSGDFRARDLGCALDPYLYQIADKMKEYCKNRRTVVFLPLVRTSQKFRDILNEKGFRVAEVNGESADRVEILRDFSDGKYDILCNSMLLTEGWDCPAVDCVVVLRPTKVRSLYCQMIGRGTRLCENKEDLLLLDFLWHTERHELCRPAHLICGSDEVAKRMIEKSEQSGEITDIVDGECDAERDVVAERERVLAEQLLSLRNRKQRLVDPLQFEFSIQAEDLSGYVPSFGWELSPVSEKQGKLLEKFGINPDEIGCSGKAARIIDKLKKRTLEGLTTPKQIRFLESRGFVHVGTWQLEEAKRLIDRIAANGWRIPYGITPAEYIPKNEVINK